MRDEVSFPVRYRASMASPRSRQAARLRERRRRAQRRARLLVLFSAVGVLGVVTLLLTAFGSSGSTTVAAPISIASPEDAAAVRPPPRVLATIGNLHLQLPVAAASLTAIGFHGATDGSLSLQPVGLQANAGILARLWHRIAGSGNDSTRWYQLEGTTAGTNQLDVGTAPGTDVYAPVQGSVVAVSDLVVGGRNVGSRIDLRPSRSPSVMVSVLHVRPDPAITVGSPVLAAASKLGTAVDLAAVEEQALAAHAPHGGNNVSIVVYPSVGSLP
jgi:hypothetical protein